MNIDKQFFFQIVRANIFGGSMDNAQVDALEAIIDQADNATPFDHIAYCMATAYHEEGPTLRPVSENLSYSAQRLMHVWPSRFPSEAIAAQYAHNPVKLAEKVYGGRLGNTEPGDGFRYRGRGPSQLTGRENYARMSRILGIDLAANPDLALDPAHATTILLEGMTRGLWTGKKLSDYNLPSGGFAFIQARAVVNGDVNENGEKIAKIARKFREAMRPAVTAAPIPAKPIPVTTVGEDDPEDHIAPPQGEPESNTAVVIVAVVIACLIAFAVYFVIKSMNGV